MTGREQELARWESTVARSWFDGVVADLTRARRHLEGGWPGTLSDARRALVLSLNDLPIALTREEIDRSARAVYRAAKGRWLEVADRSAPVPARGA